MIYLFLFLTALFPDRFTPVEGFMDLDETATPATFGLLLVAGEDDVSNLQMAELILTALDSLPEDASVDLYLITPEESGYPDIAALCGEYDGFPATLVMVGHCGYIEIDPSYLIVEIIDGWFTWGNPLSRRTGICNFCTRCNP